MMKSPLPNRRWHRLPPQKPHPPHDGDSQAWVAGKIDLVSSPPCFRQAECCWKSSTGLFACIKIKQPVLQEPAVLMWCLLHLLAAIDGDVGAGDETCQITGQEHNQGGDFFGLAQTAYRDLSDDLLTDVVRYGHHHVGGGVAG